MWEKLALLPLTFQGFLCPHRGASDSILLAIACWTIGVITGSFCTALILSPWLRRVLCRIFAVVIWELNPPAARGREERLARYRD